MNYPAPQYAAAAQPAQSGAIAGIASASICCIAALSLLVIGAIALGVGLGVGLSTRNNGSSGGGVVGVGGNNNPPATTTTTAGTNISANATAPAPAGNFAILPAPVVNCNAATATCGCPAIQPLFAAPRIVQGYTARPNSWPWVVNIAVVINTTFTGGCGGTLITTRHVLTAAHCFLRTTTPGAVTVRAGVQTLSNANEGQTLAVTNIILHPNYDGTPGSNFPNDIAILTLQNPVTLSRTIGICCLSYNTALPAVGDTAVVIGWGLTTNAGQGSDVLLQAVIRVENPSATCQVQSTNIQFCAGFAGTDTCQGDSGGPLMTSVNNAWTCTGIVSFGGICGAANGVYVRVSAYQQFITTNTAV